MDNETAFVTRLTSFGLSEKEAYLYLRLLKYGPKTPSPLAKSLNTYREDVHRTLTALIDKGMVRPSLDSPTSYAAVGLDMALESALKKQEGELREMEARKRELQQLAKQQRFRPSDEVSTFKLIKSVKEMVTATMTLVSSAKQGFIYVVPAETLVITSLFGINAEAKKLKELGGYAKGITDVAYADIAPAQEVLDIGEDLRHYPDYGGIYFAVVDKKQCVSAINVDIKRISLNEPISMIWTDDSTYADYLSSTFEILWEQSVPAAERIQELLKRGPPQT
ncbi:MAG TPA: helix-turn-helix domain-containing protein [Candidatus Bathyarchaeia archaeon]|nr:helix-turn-helix domain-containing protein [Candidatus Bathyarchaeia archaeon]